MNLDLEYVEEKSPWLDLKIIATDDSGDIGVGVGNEESGPNWRGAGEQGAGDSQASG